MSIGGLLALGACGTISAMMTPVSPAEVATIEDSVTIADILALNYTRLPPCSAAVKLCAVAGTKQSIKLYALKARDAVAALRTSSASGAPAALVAAQAALAALQASIPASSTAN